MIGCDCGSRIHRSSPIGSGSRRIRQWIGGGLFCCGCGCFYWYYHIHGRRRIRIRFRSCGCGGSYWIYVGYHYYNPIQSNALPFYDNVMHKYVVIVMSMIDDEIYNYLILLVVLDSIISDWWCITGPWKWNVVLAFSLVDMGYYLGALFCCEHRPATTIRRNNERSNAGARFMVRPIEYRSLHILMTSLPFHEVARRFWDSDREI